MIFSTHLRKFIIHLLMLNVVLIFAGFISGALTNFFEPVNVIICSLSFSLISIVTVLIFLRGQTKEPDSQTIHTLVSIVVKFLLDMVLALIWFVAAKKNSLPSVIIFFVIYLTLTLYLVSTILKVLKTKPL